MGNQIAIESAYPTAEQVMNRARAFVNDAFRQGKGRILTDQAPFSIEFLNSAFEELQDKIGNNGVITLIKDNVILGPLTPLPAVDPAVQTFISYSGFFDGTDMSPLPALPSDLRAVLALSERQVGSNMPFAPMRQPQAGLPSVYQTQFLRYFEWRTDRIYMIGSTSTEELKLRYETRFPILNDADDFANTQISILSSVNALATVVAYVYARARGAQLFQMLQADGERMMRYIVRRYTRAAQGRTYHRIPYGGYPQGGNADGQMNGNLPM